MERALWEVAAIRQWRGDCMELGGAGGRERSDAGCVAAGRGLGCGGAAAIQGAPAAAAKTARGQITKPDISRGVQEGACGSQKPSEVDPSQSKKHAGGAQSISTSPSADPCRAKRSIGGKQRYMQIVEIYKHIDRNRSVAR